MRVFLPLATLFLASVACATDTPAAWIDNSPVAWASQKSADPCTCYAGYPCRCRDNCGCPVKIERNYSKARKQAAKHAKPLLVFVGLARPFAYPGAVICYVEAFHGIDIVRGGIVVGKPSDDGDLWRVADLPSYASTDDVKRSLLRCPEKEIAASRSVGCTSCAGSECSIGGYGPSGCSTCGGCSR